MNMLNKNMLNKKMLNRKVKKILESMSRLFSCPSFVVPFSYLLFLLIVAFIFFLIGECLVLILETVVARLDERDNLLSIIELQDIELEELKNSASQLKDEKNKSLVKLRELKQKIAIVEEIKNSATKK